MSNIATLPTRTETPPSFAQMVLRAGFLAAMLHIAEVEQTNKRP